MRLAVFAVVLLSSSLAAAQAPGQTMSWEVTPPPVMIPAVVPAGPPTTVSYRSHVLMADGISFGLMLLGPALDQDGGEAGARLASLGFSGYVLGAPIVHLAHGRGGAAVKSFGLRTLLPIAGAYLGYQLGPDDTHCVYEPSSVEEQEYGHSHGGGCGGGSIAGLVLGGIAGIGTAIYIDAAYLAKYERPAPLVWSAGVRRTTGGYSVSLSRSF